jgi:hypothetical protein
MRSYGLIIIALAAGILCAAPARADHHPVIAVPGNPGAPVIIDGQIATWALVEGDWGLYRPGEVTPVIIHPYVPADGHSHTRGYYPSTGKRPRSGRVEVIPPANRRLPPQAESYYRYWSNGAPPVPAQIEYPAPLPPVILAPRVRARN